LFHFIRGIKTILEIISGLLVGTDLISLSGLLDLFRGLGFGLGQDLNLGVYGEN